MISQSALFISVFIFTRSLNALHSNDKNDCIMEHLSSFVSRNQMNKVMLDSELASVMKPILSSVSNINQQLIIATIVTNFNILPDDLQTEMRNCPDNSESLMAQCESFYGQGNCERVHKFSVGHKCPATYVRNARGICSQNCLPHQIVIESNCNGGEARMIDHDETFATREECLDKKRFCVSANGSGNSFVEGCGPHEKDLGFMCLPVCLDEMDSKMLEALQTNANYCIKRQTVSKVGFYDL